MGKTFVITGSTRGIGSGIAANLLARGHSVVVSGRSLTSVTGAVEKLTGAATAGGGRVQGIACDVTQRDQLQRLWQEAVRAFGRVDVWVNNAGVANRRQRVGELRESDVRAVVTTDLLGMMHGTQIALSGMLAQGAGTIYNMEGFGSSGMTTPGMSLYGASKFALTYFNKCLISETRHTAVRICYLSPGIVVTDLLKEDMASASGEDWERTQRVYNILADRVETVTPYLADGIARDQKHGARVAWLTSSKAAGRFISSIFRKRVLLTDIDRPH
ncbi:MAG: SDR family oxidoreductase [Pseudomonadales bacterium]|nr:SDR family oxidoreductase [Pseudomonadales bacterium]